MRTDFPENDLRFDRALYVRELQTYLRIIAATDNRVPLIEADGVFGNETAAAVKAAQGCAHLPETGQVDFATWNAIVHAAQAAKKRAATPLGIHPFTHRTPPLCEGDHSAIVPFVQSMFCGLCHRFSNFEEEAPSDEMTAVTCRNVREIQRAYGQPQTGVLDEAVWNELARTYDVCAVEHTRVPAE